jgi:hypothetical protein
MPHQGPFLFEFIILGYRPDLDSCVCRASRQVPGAILLIVGRTVEANITTLRQG